MGGSQPVKNPPFNPAYGAGDPLGDPNVLRALYQKTGLTPGSNIVPPPGPSQVTQTPYGQGTPQYQVDNNGRQAWNNYVAWLGKKGMAGNPALNTNGLGHQMLSQYMQENPNSGLTPDNVVPIQQDFENYRQYNLNRIQKGTMDMQPGTTQQNFMANISKVDGYPGSNTTSYTFSPQYMQSVDQNNRPIMGTDGKPVVQNTGFASSHNFKRGGKMQYGGNSVSGLNYSLYDNMDTPSWLDTQSNPNAAITDPGSSVTAGPNSSQYTQQDWTSQQQTPGSFSGPNALATMQGAQAGLSILSGAMERGRQNQYMNTQYAGLGQRNAMPTSNYQPNPYNQYSQYGGSIRKYQMGGNTFLQGSQPIPNYLDQVNQSNPLGQPQFQHGGMNHIGNLSPQQQQQLIHQMNQHVAPYKGSQQLPQSHTNSYKDQSSQGTMQQGGSTKSIQAIINAYANMKNTNSTQIMHHLQNLSPEQQTQMIHQMTQETAPYIGSPSGQPIQEQAQDSSQFLQAPVVNPAYQDQPQPGNNQMQHGGQTQQAGQLAQIIQAYAQLVHQNPQQIMQEIHKLPAKQQQAALQQMAQAVQQAQAQQQQQGQQAPQQMQGQPQGQPQQMPQQDQQQQPEMKSGGNWLRGAVNPAHKGWCTPMSNPKCTGHRRAFALMMKKNHGFH